MKTYGFELDEASVLKALKEFYENQEKIDELVKNYRTGKPKTRFIQYKGELFGLKRVMHHAHYLTRGAVNDNNPTSDEHESILRKIVSDEWEIIRQEKESTKDRISNPIDKKDKEVMRAISNRRGQPEFRRRLLTAYERKCCVTGCKVESVLEAAHIQAHSEGENYKTSNGLLLRADMHTLFDLNLISISKNYTVLIDSDLEHSEYAEFEDKKIFLPREKTDWPIFI